MAQHELFETAEARSLLDQLLDDSRLYRSSKDYFDLLAFVARLRTFAPFNAMLLHMQKPAIAYAATPRDWHERFGRKPICGARPLLILMPFGPVALVYDLVDTEGRPVPEDAFFFRASGPMTEFDLARMVSDLQQVSIKCVFVDAGDSSAGSIGATRRATKERPTSEYTVNLNKNHAPAVQFATLAHELAHLYLGHLGADKVLKISDRREASHEQRELEAESVSYLVCKRNGVESKSETYLTDYVDKHTTVDSIDLYQVMRITGQVEGALGLSARERERPGRPSRNAALRARLAGAQTASEDLSTQERPKFVPSPRGPGRVEGRKASPAKLFAGAVLVIASASVAASDWQTLTVSAMTEPALVEIDQASLIDDRDGNHHLWLRFSYATPHIHDGRPPKSFRVMRALVTISCPGRRLRYEAAQFFTRTDRERAVAQEYDSGSPSRDYPIAPDSVGDALLARVCPAKTGSLSDWIDSLPPPAAHK